MSTIVRFIFREIANMKVYKYMNIICVPSLVLLMICNNQDYILLNIVLSILLPTILFLIVFWFGYVISSTVLVLALIQNYKKIEQTKFPEYTEESTGQKYVILTPRNFARMMGIDIVHCIYYFRMCDHRSLVIIRKSTNEFLSTYKLYCRQDSK